jgi:hypothetical protein
MLMKEFDTSCQTQLKNYCKFNVEEILRQCKRPILVTGCEKNSAVILYVNN